jgi:hypothetical protein
MAHRVRLVLVECEEIPAFVVSCVVLIQVSASTTILTPMHCIVLCCGLFVLYVQHALCLCVPARVEFQVILSLQIMHETK